MDIAVLSLAALAGAVAAFNPCGFALLPAYLGMIAHSATNEPSTRATMFRSLMRGVRFAAGMTVGFMLVFGTAAAIFLPFAGVVARTLPYVTIGIGVLLFFVGAWLLSGREIRIRKLPGFSGRAPNAGGFSQIGYGITFSVASLSCTIGPFLAMVSVAAAADTAITSVAAFVAYALGMGLVALSLAVIVTVTSGTLVARIRNAAPVINRVSGGLLLLAGAYVAWYGWFEVRVLADPATQDPVVSAITSVQSLVSATVIEVFSSGLWFEVVVLLVGILAILGISWAAARKVHQAWRHRKCLQVRRRVHAYLDMDPSAPLSDEEINRIEEHLTACPDCTEVVRDLRHLQQSLRELGYLDEDSALRVQRSWERFREELSS